MTAPEDLTQARIDIARMEVQIETLTQGLDDLRASNAQLTAKLDQVLLALSEARGGWKTLMLVGGAASSIGAGLTWVAQHLGGNG
jgi:outer membrane protein TolC